MEETQNTNTATQQQQAEEKQQITAVDTTNDITIVSNGEVLETGDKTEPTEPATEEGAGNVPPVQAEAESVQKEMEQAKETLADKGVDYSELEKEYTETGSLSEESYKKLSDAGYPKQVVDAILAGWQAKADAFYNTVINSVGGSDEFTKIQQFVSKQGKEAIAAFDEIVSKTNLNVVTSYLVGIKAQMVAKYGTTNPSLGGASTVETVSGFANANEMIKAMSDPRYAKDAKYTKQVEERVAKSTFF